MPEEFSEATIQWQIDHMDVFEFDANGDCVYREPTRDDAIAVLRELEIENRKGN
jgi:hypothetical protein